MTAGTIATRRSPGYVSRGTPTIIQLPPSSPYRVAHTQYRQSETNGLICPSQSREFSSRGPRRCEWLPCGGRRGSETGGAGADHNATTHFISCGTTRQIIILHANLRKSNRRWQVGNTVPKAATQYGPCPKLSGCFHVSVIQVRMAPPRRIPPRVQPIQAFPLGPSCWSECFRKPG